MASTSRRAGAPVSLRLAEQPYQFEFFQAVRVLERMARQRAESSSLAHASGCEAWVPVGADGPPKRETVRFRALVSHAFPPSEVCSLKLREDHGGEPEAPLAEMTVAFMGLTGPSGVLPQHYTQLVIERVRRKDESLRDFLDLFNHRFISLFFRAWEKYRLPAAFERALSDPDAADEDLFTRALYCLVGLGTERLRGRLRFPDPVFLYFSGHCAHRRPTVAALESMIEEYFQLPVRVLQFEGQWLYLSAEDQTQMPAARDPDGRNCRLGWDVVVGQRVWSVENKFRVRLGPLDYESFCRFTPLGDGLVPLCQLIRCRVGPEFDFDIQPVLKADEVPWCRAGGDERSASRLGWNTWLRSRPMPADGDEAVFVNEGNP